MQAEESFGVIPLHRQGIDWRVLLVHHQKGHWGFPKGHAEAHETPHTTAERELQEETGLAVVAFLPFSGLTEHYQVDGHPKTVTYFLAEVEGHVIPQEAEIETAEWFTFDEAFKRLTFPEGRDLVRKAEKMLQSARHP